MRGAGPFPGRRQGPLPNSASQETASLLGAPVDVVPDAGHLIWYEKPGVVRASLDKLLRR